VNENEIIKLLSDLKHRIFPRPFERLAVSGKNLVGVEIGVYKAEHAESLLKHLNVECLFLVDPYDLYGDYSEGKSHYGVDQDPLEVARNEATRRLLPYADKIKWIHKLSTAAVAELPNGLDFVYIDGNHAESFVREDITNYYAKVRPGGVLGGHDFYNGFCREHDGVVKAVTEFVTRHSLPLQVELPDWWVTKSL
jgi:hypothetical protein